MTPLFVACSYGYVDITRRLLDAGAVLLAKDETLQTPLHRAAMEGHLVRPLPIYNWSFLIFLCVHNIKNLYPGSISDL